MRNFNESAAFLGTLFRIKMLKHRAFFVFYGGEGLLSNPLFCGVQGSAGASLSRRRYNQVMNWMRPIFLSGIALLFPCLCVEQTPAQEAFDPLSIPHPSLDNSGPIVQSHLQDERQRFDAVIRSNPAPSAGHRAQAYARLARVYHTYQFNEAALACYLNLDRIQPGIYPCQYAIGWIYHNQGLFDQALRYLAEAKRIAQGLDDTPPSVTVAMNCLIGDASLKQEKLPEAMKTFKEAVELDPQCAYAWHGMGLVYSIEGNSIAAIECLERAVELQPRASVGKVLLAREYRRAGLAEKAASVLPGLDNNRTTPFVFFDPIISRDVAPLNRSAAAVHSRALGARQQGDIQLSVDLFKRAIELNPRFTSAKANLASAYLSLNRLEEAETWAGQILDEEPDNASFQDLLGVVLFKRGKFDEAMGAFRRAQELEPDQGIHAYWMGAALSWHGNHKEALAMFEKAVNLKDADAGARIGVAVMMTRLGRYSEAMESLRRCRELFPGSVQVKLNLAQFLSAYPDSTRNDGERALALSLPVFDQMKSVPAAVSLAMAYAATGDFAKAAEVQQWAIRHAAEQGYAADLPWLNRNLQLYQDGKPCHEPWNNDTGYPAIEGLLLMEAAP
ncbi:MAG: tetratricopeptide repeat protein [Verrucomicrobia bacterium]|nr:tetratricopeptide repeat protein [Verrucomicrobiota bacterium]